MTTMPRWAWFVPLVAVAMLVAVWALPVTPALACAAAAVLIGTVFAAVYHAEVVAHRLGEPFGALVLAIAVTVIEVGLIVSIMAGGGSEKASLARDTVFATTMLVSNGVVGLSLLVGGVLHHEQQIRPEGANAALAVLAALTVLTLVLPNFTVTTPGPVFSHAQLVFAGAVSLALYAAFLFAQTVRYRAYFLPDDEDGEASQHRVRLAMALASFGLLLVCLVAVVGVAKALTHTLEDVIVWSGAPKAVVGIIIAAVVLLPESLSAIRAAWRNRLQTSINLALGSALASIGLTIPAVAVASLLLQKPLTLGLDPIDEVLLALTLLVATITLGTGRTNLLQGMVHLVILGCYLFLSVVP